MKVFIGPYLDFLGPYQIAEKLLFWLDKDEDRRVHKFGEFLANGFSGKSDHYTWLHKACNWIHSKKTRTQKIVIHPYDSWSMDSTLSPIILPLLQQLKATKNGSGFVDLEDVPENLRYDQTEDYEPQQCFDFYNENTEQNLKCDLHTRYEWVLDEMIWAFEQLTMDDWEEQYWIKHPELDLDDYSEDVGKVSIPVRWKIEGVCDWEGRKKHQERINNGLRLFGKYFQTLWD